MNEINVVNAAPTQEEIQKLTADQEMIQALAQTVEDLMKTVNELTEENKFLSDTILKEHMGHITAERRKDKKEVEKAFQEAEKIALEGKRMYGKYKKKLDALTGIIARVQSAGNSKKTK